ncbi:MAG: hypothetical protein JNJ43_19390, partial [Anaerolineales bacterium]|nr:hypothetical protein [Anaerolineales bacterium]
VLLNENEIENALNLLESDESSRAALLPVDKTSEVLKTSEVSGAIGIASELINTPDELKNAVRLMLGQTLIVRDRTTAKKLVKDIP